MPTTDLAPAASPTTTPGPHDPGVAAATTASATSGPEPAAPRRWLSVSSTREYERCPRRHRYAYIERLPYDRHVPPAWRIGTAVHAGLEAAYRHREQHPDAPLSDGLPAALVALRASWDELELSHDDGSYARAGRQLAAALDRDVLGRREVLGVELALREEVADDTAIVGLLDLALRLGPTTVQIVDHKVTGRRATPQQLIADLQLNLYGALVRRTWPDTTAVVATLHYPTGPEAVSVRLTEEGMAAARRRVLDVGATAVADELGEPTPGAHCDHCPWRARCPAG